MRILSTILLFWVATASTAWACSCVEGPLESAVSEAGAIFSGEVFEILDVPGSDSFIRQRAITLRIEDSWKGLEADATTVTLLTSSQGSTCGYDFRKGQRYLVYAFRWKGSWSTNLCTRTMPIADAEEDLTFLETLEPA